MYLYFYMCSLPLTHVMVGRSVGRCGKKLLLKNDLVKRNISTTTPSIVKKKNMGNFFLHKKQGKKLWCHQRALNMSIHMFLPSNFVRKQQQKKKEIFTFSISIMVKCVWTEQNKSNNKNQKYRNSYLLRIPIYIQYYWVKIQWAAIMIL